MSRPLIKMFDYLLESATTGFYIVMIICVVIQVICRYALGIATPWSEELARYLLVCITFMGAAICSRKGHHLGAFFLRDKAGPRVQALMLIFSCSVVLAFLYVLVFGGIKMIDMTWETTAVTMPLVRTAYLYARLGDYARSGLDHYVPSVSN